MLEADEAEGDEEGEVERSEGLASARLRMPISLLLSASLMS